MDDDISEHLDPELDDAVTESSGSLPGSVTLPRIVLALHVFTAVLILPLAVTAWSDGSIRRFAVFLAMIVALVATGVVVARITARRY